MEAMRLLGEGAKVTHAALESGYSTHRSIPKLPRNHAHSLLQDLRLTPPKKCHPEQIEVPAATLALALAVACPPLPVLIRHHLNQSMRTTCQF